MYTNSTYKKSTKKIKRINKIHKNTNFFTKQYKKKQNKKEKMGYKKSPKTY